MPIREYEKRDRDALLDLVAAHGSQERAKQLSQFWQWQFEDNPFREPGNALGLVLEAQGSVVGALLSFPVPLKIGDRDIIANCMSDFIVHPDHRGGGIGLALKMTRLPIYIWGSPNRDSHPLWHKLGSTDLCRMDSLSCIVDVYGAVRERGLSSTFSRLIAGAWSPMNSYFNRPEPPPSDDLQVEVISEFDASFDLLWAELRDEQPIRVVKDHKYLDWRFNRCPRQYVLLACRRHGRLTGYLACRMAEPPTAHKGYIVDVLTRLSDHASLDALLGSAKRLLQAKGAHSVCCVVSNRSTAFLRRLRRHGFVFKRWSYGVIGSPHFRANHVAGDLAEGHWTLQKGDGELDLLPDH